MMQNKFQVPAFAASMLGMFAIAGAPAHAQHADHDGWEGQLVATTETSVSPRWNEIARQAASAAAQYTPHSHGGPAMGGRLYAVLSLAQLAASEATEGPAERLAVATASWAILREAFPGSADLIDSQLQADRAVLLASGADPIEGEAEGQEAAARVLAWAADDGHDVPFRGTLRSGASDWVAAPGADPIGTNWGAVRPWILASNADFRPEAPPAVGTPEFEEALDEVRRVSREVTADQTALAQKWMHPVDGYWNEVAAQLVRESRLQEDESAQVFTVMNAAIVDAVITCFDTKYHFQYPRPSHIDPSISMAVALPNHPSFVSGHACVSGAASGVLSHFFPEQRRNLTTTADEIAMSRLYAGVHYRFDNDIGLAIGRAIADKATSLQLTSGELVGR